MFIRDEGMTFLVAYPAYLHSVYLLVTQLGGMQEKNQLQLYIVNIFT